MAQTNTFTGASAVPFNPNTQTFGSAPTQSNQMSMGAVNLNTGVSAPSQNYQVTPIQPANIPQSQSISTFNTQPIKLPTQTPTQIQPTSNYAMSGLQNIPTPVQDAASGISQTMLQLIPQLQGQSQELTNQKQALGVDTMRTNLQNLNNQILQKQAELTQQDVSLAQGLQNIEDQTIPMQFITGQQLSVEKRANLAKAVKVSQINMLNASALAAQGNIALANDMAQQAVDAKFAPVKDMYNTLQAQLQAIQPLLSAEEKKVAAQQSMMADVQKQLLTIKADQQKNIANLLMQSQANGIDQGTYSKALNAYNNGASDVEVASIIGAYGGKDYLANKDILDVSRNQIYNNVGQLTTDNGYTLDLFKKGIAGVESSDNYKAIGPATSTGDKAYGKYQVMGANIPSWTKQALGYSMTPQQFLNSPDAQEKVFENQSLTNYSKYGNWDDVASVWFSGRPLSNNVSSDGYNTVPQYVAKVRQAMGVPTQPTTFSQITDPTVITYAKSVQQDKENMKYVPKGLVTAVLAYNQQNVQNNPQTQDIVEKINQIDNIISSPALSSVVGPNIFTRGSGGTGGTLGNFLKGATTGGVAGAIGGTTLFPGVGSLVGGVGGALIGGAGTAIAGNYANLSGQAQNFIGNVDQLTNQQFIDKLIAAKAQGATFGALNEQEGAALRNSATKLNGWAIKDGSGKVVGYDIDEASFLEELNKIKRLAQKGIVQAGGNILGGTVTDVYFNTVSQPLQNTSTTTYGYQF